MSLSADSVVGIDFDNTLAGYDEVIHCEAVKLGLVHAETPKDKKQVRDRIRRLEGGEVAWQRLQAVVYGSKMSEAVVNEGAMEFLDLCRRGGVAVRVVSHKKARYRYDETGMDFRAAAVDWMEHQGFFQKPAGLSRDAVHFEDTREGKVLRIAALGCTHFIDDLEEIFLEKKFPARVQKILYAPHEEESVTADIERASSWREISERLFHAVH